MGLNAEKGLAKLESQISRQISLCVANTFSVFSASQLPIPGCYPALEFGHFNSISQAPEAREKVARYLSWSVKFFELSGQLAFCIGAAKTRASGDCLRCRARQ